ncbi:MAG: hypothetical protein SGJ02_06360 [bacterium]|nr:hypothetical protein [bacterium]
MKILKTLSIAISLCLIACGGGGSGDSFVGAGNVSVKVSPDEIDTGDRVLVTVEFNEAHPDGVTIKLRYSDGFAYIPDTSILTVDGDELDSSPDANVAADLVQSTYLVYNISRSILGDRNDGKLIFELRGIESTSDNSEIEVDIDVLEANKIFSAESPEFSAQDSTGLVVK